MAMKSYTSDQPVFVDEKYYKPGETFVTDKPKGQTWKAISKAEKAVIDASEPSQGDSEQ